MLLYTNLAVIYATLQLYDSLSSTNKILFFLSLYFYLLLISSMMMLLACGYYQLHALRTVLEMFCKSHNKNSVRRILKTTSIMYDTLCDAFEEFSAFYFPNNLVFLLAFLYFTTIFNFGIYIYARDPSEQILYFTMTCFLWVAFYAPCNMWLMTFASRIESDGVKTVNLIQHLVNIDNDSTCLRSSAILVQQAMHRSPKITCFMFDLNWKFFFTMLGGIFTFSIIFIQFYDVGN